MCIRSFGKHKKIKKPHNKLTAKLQSFAKLQSLQSLKASAQHENDYAGNTTTRSFS